MHLIGCDMICHIAMAIVIHNQFVLTKQGPGPVL